MPPDRGVAIDDAAATFIEEGPRTFTDGTEISLNLVFDGRFPTDGVYGDSYGSSYGAGDYIPNYEAVHEYFRVLTDGLFHFGITDEGEPWYREDVPDWHGVDSYLVAVEFGSDIGLFRDSWALVIGGVDGSHSLPAVRQLSVDLFLLADLDDYDDKAAVRDAFEEPAF